MNWIYMDQDINQCGMLRTLERTVSFHKIWNLGFFWTFWENVIV